MIIEVVRNIACRSAPKARGRTPVGRRRCFFGNIRRNVCAGKVPQGHARRGVPQKGKDTPAGIVKPVTKRTRIRVLDGASRIGGRGAIALLVEDGASKGIAVRRVDRAGVRCPAVKRHLIMLLIIDALHNIDLSSRRPVGSVGLQSTTI